MASFFYAFIRPFFFVLAPEAAHAFFEKMLRLFFWLLPAKEIGTSSTEIHLGRKKLAHPVLLAGGFDKYAKLFPYLNRLGFSGAEIGSFTPLPQPGNEKPRLWRFAKEKALLNRMGFNNCGLPSALEQVQMYKGELPLAISLGKQKTTALEAAGDEYAKMLDTLAQKVSAEQLLYIAVNISSPNTAGLRDLQTREFLINFCKKLRQATNAKLFAKLAPDFPNQDAYQTAIAVPIEQGFDGLILCNTTQDYERLDGNQARQIAKKHGGGVSGKPLADLAKRRLFEAREFLGDEPTIIASGSVMEPSDILNRLLLGADAVQVYTGLIYSGPSLISKGVKLLSEFMNENGLANLKELKVRRKEFLD